MLDELVVDERRDVQQRLARDLRERLVVLRPAAAARETPLQARLLLTRWCVPSSKSSTTRGAEPKWGSKQRMVAAQAFLVT